MLHHLCVVLSCISLVGASALFGLALSCVVLHQPCARAWACFCHPVGLEAASFKLLATHRLALLYLAGLLSCGIVFVQCEAAVAQALRTWADLTSDSSPI